MSPCHHLLISAENSSFCLPGFLLENFTHKKTYMNVFDEYEGPWGDLGLRASALSGQSSEPQHVSLFPHPHPLLQVVLKHKRGINCESRL